MYWKRKKKKTVKAEFRVPEQDGICDRNRRSSCLRGKEGKTEKRRNGSWKRTREEERTRQENRRRQRESWKKVPVQENTENAVEFEGKQKPAGNE